MPVNTKDYFRAKFIAELIIQTGEVSKYTDSPYFPLARAMLLDGVFGEHMIPVEKLEDFEGMVL